MENELWGMPLELAVGLVGLGGALLGALVAAAATVWVARWQSREQRRQARLDKLDDAVADLWEATTDLLLEGTTEPGYTFKADETVAIHRVAFIAMLRSRRSAPELDRELRECLHEGGITRADVNRLAEVLVAWFDDSYLTRK